MLIYRYIDFDINANKEKKIMTQLALFPGQEGSWLGQVGHRSIVKLVSLLYYLFSFLINKYTKLNDYIKIIGVGLRFSGFTKMAAILNFQSACEHVISRTASTNRL